MTPLLADFTFHVSRDDDGTWYAAAQQRPGLATRFTISGHGDHPITALHECIVATQTAIEIVGEDTDAATLPWRAFTAQFPPKRTNVFVWGNFDGGENHIGVDAWTGNRWMGYSEVSHWCPLDSVAAPGAGE